MLVKAARVLGTSPPPSQRTVRDLFDHTAQPCPFTERHAQDQIECFPSGV